jgi:hypothetical protein
MVTTVISPIRAYLRVPATGPAFVHLQRVVTDLIS